VNYKSIRKGDEPPKRRTLGNQNGGGERDGPHRHWGEFAQNKLLRKGVKTDCIRNALAIDKRERTPQRNRGERKLASRLEDSACTKRKNNTVLNKR